MSRLARLAPQKAPRRLNSLDHPLFFSRSTSLLRLSLPFCANLRPRAHTKNNATQHNTRQGSAPDIRADERTARLLACHSLSVPDMVRVLYPSLYSIHDLPPDIGDDSPPAPPAPAASEAGAAGTAARGVEGVWGRPRSGVDVPVALPPTAEKLSSSGVFLLDDGEELLLYVGRSVSREVMSELFGVDAVPGECLGTERKQAVDIVERLSQELRDICANSATCFFVHIPSDPDKAHQTPRRGKFVLRGAGRERDIFLFRMMSRRVRNNRVAPLSRSVSSRRTAYETPDWLCFARLVHLRALPHT